MAGWSLSRMSKAAGYTVPYLSQVECGKRRPTESVVDAYGQALGGGGVDRRSLLTGLLAGAVTPSALRDGILAGFEKALNDPRPHVDDWLERVESYGRDYMSLGATVLQPRLARDLVILQGKLDSPDLWGAAARLLTVQGKTLPSASEDGAVRWYKAAAAAADRSGDLATRVWVRGRAGLALAYEGAGLATAATLAEQALALSDRPSLGSLNAHMALAHVAAQRGDTATALAEAQDGERAFDAAGSADDAASDFAVPEWRMRTFTSMLYSRLGDERAVAEQERADATRPATLPRFGVHIELHRGLMLVKAGDRHGGLSYAQDALAKLPTDKHSLSLRLMMAEIEGLAATGV